MGTPPTPPGGLTEGVHFDPEWLAVRYALDLPPTRGVPPPDPLLGGIQTYVVHFFQIRSEGVLIVPHLDITTFSSALSDLQSLQTVGALHLSCVKVMGFRLRRDVALIRGSNNVICSNACSRICDSCYLAKWRKR